ncbi:DUF134 domain-containing protein [Desulfovibrio aerotolerans]|uniref:UPF0251 protein GTA51_15300 n=1 Tax=Solidesulfovibrio aerotolerans TaxID=295255 RepID=A0A7C9ITF4_9BACT|nr:DUF134 domain-containing protein [Solidesulfovibrio aerotolerans]MYL84487.1 DUF134 domain-containing protein [Solidesulfovibrio aerotolerans]
MPRRRLCRRVTAAPAAVYFKPQGIVRCDLGEVVLAVEGLEALRLADLEGLTSDAAAVGMGVSRHTFGRVLAEARATVARALVGGLALRIAGGAYQLAGDEPAAAQSENETSNAPTQTVAANQALKEHTMPGRGTCGRSGQGQGTGQGQQNGTGRGQGMGQGQQNGTGMGQGQCLGQGTGRGQGRGGGRGRGLGNGLGQTTAPDQATGPGQGGRADLEHVGGPQQASAMPAALSDTVTCPRCGKTVVAVAGGAGPVCPQCGLGVSPQQG